MFVVLAYINNEDFLVLLLFEKKNIEPGTLFFKKLPVRHNFSPSSQKKSYPYLIDLIYDRVLCRWIIEKIVVSMELFALALENLFSSLVVWKA